MSSHPSAKATGPEFRLLSSMPSQRRTESSGRLLSWSDLLEFAKLHPWQTLLGVGYKTLPYSAVAGRLLVVDNTFLDLLIETGVLGLFTFLALNSQILRFSFQAARNENGKTAFYGTWIFCFWVGEIAQMFTGD